MFEFNHHATGTAAALKAFDKIIMQRSESVNLDVLINIIHRCGYDGIIEGKKLSKSDMIEMKEINTVLSEIRSSISKNGVGIFNKVIMIFQSADPKLAEQMKCKWMHTT